MTLQDDIKKAHEAKEKLQEVLGREPFDTEIASEVGFSLDKTRKLLYLKVEEKEDVEESSHSLRFKLTIKNHEMEKARQLLGLSQLQLGDKTKLSYATLSQIECCRMYPDKERQKIIAKALMTTPQKLFPEWLQTFSEKWKRQEKSRIVPMNELSLSNQSVLMLDDGSYESMIRKEDNDLFKKRLDKVALTPKEKEVIYLRYGFMDGASYILSEIADKMGVTRERIRQIESKALEKLRYKTDIFGKEGKLRTELEDIRSRKNYNLVEEDYL